MESSPARFTWIVLWGLAAVSIIVLCLMLISPIQDSRGMGLFMLVSGILLFVLGGLLIYFTRREQVSGLPRVFFILTGASALGIPVCVVLHNVVYGLFIHFFGPGFWEGIGLPDEPVFFTLGIVVCPIGLATGIVGSIVLARRRAVRPPSA